VRELAVQALSSVEDGYDLLAPKFDHTPFPYPDAVFDATADALGPLDPFRRGLDVCCGTGAGLRVLTSLCQGPVTGTDFSTGMLTQARHAHPGATWVRADVRALPFARAFDLAVTFGHSGISCPPNGPHCSPGCTVRCGRAGFSPSRSARRSPSPRAGTGRWPGWTWPCGSATRCGVPVLMHYRTCPLDAVRNDLTASGFTVTTLPLTALGQREDGSPKARLVLARTVSTP
jgi:Methyltransferase domain